jgi:hypothetical protein
MAKMGKFARPVIVIEGEEVGSARFDYVSDFSWSMLVYLLNFGESDAEKHPDKICCCHGFDATYDG